MDSRDHVQEECYEWCVVCGVWKIHVNCSTAFGSTRMRHAERNITKVKFDI